MHGRLRIPLAVDCRSPYVNVPSPRMLGTRTSGSVARYIFRGRFVRPPCKLARLLRRTYLRVGLSISRGHKNVSASIYMWTAAATQTHGRSSGHIAGWVHGWTVIDDPRLVCARLGLGPGRYVPVRLDRRDGNSAHVRFRSSPSSLLVLKLPEIVKHVLAAI